MHAAARSPACLTRIQGFISATPRPYHRGQGGVQAGLRLAVVGIAVLVAAAVVDEADLEVHPTLQPAGKYRRHDDKNQVAVDSNRSQNRAPCWTDAAEGGSLGFIWEGWGVFDQNTQKMLNRTAMKPTASTTTW